MEASEVVIRIEAVSPTQMLWVGFTMSDAPVMLALSLVVG